MAIDIRGMTPLLQVFDMRASIAFYRDVLGFEVVSRSEPQPDRNPKGAAENWQAGMKFLKQFEK
ncbi:MAG: VOC family protein [Candidatus Acidiferrales bacterium]